MKGKCSAQAKHKNYISKGKGSRIENPIILKLSQSKRLLIRC